MYNSSYGWLFITILFLFIFGFLGYDLYRVDAENKEKNRNEPRFITSC